MMFNYKPCCLTQTINSSTSGITLKTGDMVRISDVDYIIFSGLIYSSISNSYDIYVITAYLQKPAFQAVTYQLYLNIDIKTIKIKDTILEINYLNDKIEVTIR